MNKKNFVVKVSKVLSVVLCLAILITVSTNLSQPLVANANDIEIWDGTNTLSLPGSGTVDDPYTISNGSQLKFLVSQSKSKSSGKYYVITKDIYLNDPASITYDANGFAKDFKGLNWPSGSSSNYAITAFGEFAGNLNGQGHKIVGLYNGSAPAGNWGLFAKLSVNAVVTNVNVDSAYYNRSNADGSSSNTYVSGIAAAITGSNVTITGCTVYNSTFTETNSGYINFGGIIGQSGAFTGINIANCGIYANVSYGGSCVCGGIMANNSASSSGAISVSDSWSNLYPAGKSIINNSGRITYKNMYTLNSNSSSLASNAPATINIISGSVNGLDAAINMANIGWGINWDVVENGLPMPRTDVSASVIEVWDGTKSAPTQGSGTAEDPYIISSGSHLAYIATAGLEATSGKYYAISNDIYLNNPTKYTYNSSGYTLKPSAYQNCWPSGGYQNYTLVDATFGGHLNGNGYTVFGLYNDYAPNGHWALFARLGPNTSINNLNLDSIYYQPNTTTDWTEGSNYYTSSFASVIEGNNVTLHGCTVTRSTYSDSSKWKRNGGIVGCLYAYSKIEFSHCSFDANVTGSANQQFWGIYNDAWNGGNQVLVNNCWSNQPIYYKNNLGHVVFKDCYTTSTEKIVSGITSVAPYTASQLKGDVARAAMPNLDWDYAWKIDTNGSPKIASENFDTSWKKMGNGTSNDPYKITGANTLFNAIYTASVLENDAYAGKYFEIQNDIVINDTPTYTFPVYALTRKWFASSNTKGFRAILDGKGHTISGLYATNSSGAGMTGLVPVLGDGGVVANINIENSFISSSGDGWSGAGAIVGGLGLNAHAKIYGCHVADDVTVDGKANAYSGGIIGMSNRGATDLRIVYCSSAAEVSGTYKGKIAAGGWDVANTTIAHCVAIGGSSIDANKASTFKVNEKNIENVSMETVKSATVKELGLDETAWVKSTDNLPSTYYIGISWTGHADDAFDGDGTQTSPFKVYSAEQLRAAIEIADHAEGGQAKEYFRLMNDICLTDTSVSGWKYLSTDWSAPANFHFDGGILGNGHTVKGLYSVGTAEVGLIPQASNNASVTDLHLENAYVCGQIPGGIIGYVTSTGVKVEGCSVTKSEILKNTGSPYTSGGIIGTATTAVTVTDSFSDNSGADNGIIGRSWGSGNTVITNCYSVGAPAFTVVVGPKPTNVYQIDYSGTATEGTTTVSSYNEMTGLFSDDNVWYQAYGFAPQLVNKGLNFVRPDINGNGLRDDLDATSLAAVRNQLLELDGYHLDNAMGNVNGDDNNGKDIVDIRDLVHIKKCIAENKETSKVAQQEVAPYDYGTASLPMSNKSTYKLVWADEFSDATTRNNVPDNRMWVNTTNMGGVYDQKLDLNNTTIENGQLKLRTFKISDDYPGSYPNVFSVPYSCATSQTMNYRYGYAEIRAKIPAMKSSWASFWALTAKENDPIYSNTNSALGNTNVDYHTAATHTAEIDVFEICGTSALVPNMHAWPKSSGKHTTTGGTSKVIEDNTWHTVGFEWTPSNIIMYCDGTPYHTYKVNSLNYSMRTALQSPIFLIFNNHLFSEGNTLWKIEDAFIDGNAYEVGDMVTEYVIDYVRLYQSSEYTNQFYAVNPYNG